MNTLDQWEAESKKMIKAHGGPHVHFPNCERVLALIDLVRKKDQALRRFERSFDCYSEESFWLKQVEAKYPAIKPMERRRDEARSALALTEQLK